MWVRIWGFYARAYYMRALQYVMGIVYKYFLFIYIRKLLGKRRNPPQPTALWVGGVMHYACVCVRVRTPSLDSLPRFRLMRESRKRFPALENKKSRKVENGPEKIPGVHRKRQGPRGSSGGVASTSLSKMRISRLHCFGLFQTSAYVQCEIFFEISSYLYIVFVSVYRLFSLDCKLLIFY